ncbi:MAG: winged helix-turn-helix transcriptional regulator [Solirubrobacteraceae bacterium]
MAKRTYDQYCGLAKALDLVGERWTLLIVRELLMGHRRYTDLRRALPGIASNLLADRLEELAQVGLVERRQLPPPAPATVYDLTERGRALESAVIELGRWGAQALGPPGPDTELRASSFALGMRATFRPRLAVGLDGQYEFRIDETTFVVAVADAEVRAAEGSAPAPKLVLATDAATFLALLGGAVTPGQALDAGCATLRGSRRELARVLRIFRFPADEDSGRRA